MTGNESNKYEENWDFILKHIRLLAVNYGATVIYTSCKNNCNLNILYDYICHSLFQFDLLHMPNFSEKGAYFFPSGYDRKSRLIENDTEKVLDTNYEEKIKKERIKKLQDETDIRCEDINVFLNKLKQKRNKSKRSLIGKDNSKKYTASNYATEVNDNLNKSSTTTTANITDKLGKFQKFMPSKDIRGSGIGIKNSDKLSGEKKETNEERHNRTREEMLKRLGITKDRKSGLKLDTSHK